MKVALAKKLKRNRGYTCQLAPRGGPTDHRSVDHQYGEMQHQERKVKCRKSTGKKTVTLTARARQTRTLLEFTQAIKRKVG